MALNLRKNMLCKQAGKAKFALTRNNVAILVHADRKFDSKFLHTYSGKLRKLLTVVE